jgi:hypothetical protein
MAERGSGVMGTGSHSPGHFAGHSRPEVVFLLACALIVVSLLIPGFFAWQRREKLVTARWDLAALLEAGHRYYDEYGVWPSAYAGDAADARYGTEMPNAELVNILRAVDGSGNGNHAANSHRIVFFQAPMRVPEQSGLDEAGNFVDPWGGQYQIVVDANLDNECDLPNSIYNNLIGEGMIAWSAGPDGKSDTADDLLSWKIARRVQTQIIR